MFFVYLPKITAALAVVFFALRYVYLVVVTCRELAKELKFLANELVKAQIRQTLPVTGCWLILEKHTGECLLPEEKVYNPRPVYRFRAQNALTADVHNMEVFPEETIGPMIGPMKSGDAFKIYFDRKLLEDRDKMSLKHALQVLAHPQGPQMFVGRYVRYARVWSLLEEGWEP